MIFDHFPKVCCEFPRFCGWFPGCVGSSAKVREAHEAPDLGDARLLQQGQSISPSTWEMENWLERSDIKNKYYI